MKSWIAALLGLGALLAPPATSAATATAPAAPSDTAPTAQQIRTAIARAQRSRGLWATVNICDTRTHRHTIGIRAQMPALGFAARLSMVVQLRYYSQSSGRFEPLVSTRTPLSLGTATSGFHQAGATFTVTPPATLDATVEFSWRSGRRLLGTATRNTRAGHSGAQQGDPRGYSAAGCAITK